MDDQRRRRKDLGSAPTTPAPDHTLPNAPTTPGPPLPHADTMARGSHEPSGTLDMPASDQVQPGDPDAIGHFRVHRRLGAGGMGIVFAGEDANLGRPVAIKLVRSDADHPAYRARLLREAQAMARLKHPNVVEVYHVGDDAGRLFVAMELVEGSTLTSWLRDGHSWREIVEMFEQVGKGLVAVHHAGLVHRDFKPDNVLVDHNGRARVADFGLARLDREGDASPLGQPLTRTGAMMGTPGYMAPEQQFGGDVDARADQYSFCVALREALGGRPLDEKRWSAVPRAVRTVITRGLSYDPSDRYPTLDALLSALRRARGSDRKHLGAIVGACLVLAVAGGVIAFARAGDPDQPTAGSGSMAAPAMPDMTAAIEKAKQRNDELLKGVREANDSAIRAGVQSLADAGVEEKLAIVEATQNKPAPPPKKKTVAAKPDAGVADEDITFAAPENDLLKNYDALKKPASVVGNPAHLPLLKKTLRNLGYDGIDVAAIDKNPSAMKADLEAQIATAKDLELGIAHTKLAMVLRRTGDCNAAQEELRAAKLPSSGGNEADLWSSRGSFVFTLCDLELNNADDAYHVVMKATLHGPQEEVRFVMALIQYELGEKADAHARMIAASKSTNGRVKAALKIWLDGTGLVL